VNLDIRALLLRRPPHASGIVYRTRLDHDAFERFEIDRSGASRIVVSMWDGYTTGYVLTVTVN
jgi:hypothetical protein